MPSQVIIIRIQYICSLLLYYSDKLLLKYRIIHNVREKKPIVFMVHFCCLDNQSKRPNVMCGPQNTPLKYVLPSTMENLGIT